ARVDRLASQILLDQRELTNGQTALSRKITGQQSDMSTKVQHVRSALDDAIRSSTGATFDRHFIDAEIDYCRTLLQLIDNEMLPSAQSSERKSYLQTVRSKTAIRLLQAQEIDAQLK